MPKSLNGLVGLRLSKIERRTGNNGAEFFALTFAGKNQSRAVPRVVTVPVDSLWDEAGDDYDASTVPDGPRLP